MPVRSAGSILQIWPGGNERAEDVNKVKVQLNKTFSEILKISKQEEQRLMWPTSFLRLFNCAVRWYSIIIQYSTTGHLINLIGHHMTHRNILLFFIHFCYFSFFEHNLNSMTVSILGVNNSEVSDEWRTDTEMISFNHSLLPLVHITGCWHLFMIDYWSDTFSPP